MKTLVIGGGMAGLTYAIVACKNGHDVTVAERNARVGKKISMTGNGKCNIGNANVSPSCYNGSAIVKRVLDRVSVSEYKRFLNSCGIYTYTDSEGRMYPLSDSASNVVDCLRYQLSKFGGKLLVDTAVTAINKSGDRFEVNLGGKTMFFDKVVIACGSRSQAEAANVQNLIPPSVLTPTVPSLVPLKIRQMDATLNGLRVHAVATLTDGDIVLAREEGEVQFKEYGLSGICILNLSATIARREVLRRKGDYKIVLDTVPRLAESDLDEIVHRRLTARERDKLFYGILHNKLADHILRRVGANASSATIAHTAKNLTFGFEKLLDWSMSQVTAGGIDENRIDLNTLALPNGAVALGEVLNVDGVCGGNNLYFAAASALYTFTTAQRNKAYSLS